MADPPDVVFHDEPAVPGTHALVIGAGEYPHLGGGTAPSQATDGLRQLSSPPISARAMADWLRREYHCPGKPLASLSLLLSQADPGPYVDPVTGAGHPVPLADTAAVLTAVREWKRRGDSSPDNRLVFYFCGHGISEGDDMSLLLRDVDFDAPNPLEHTLDFRRLVDGLRRCAASEQLFFVDACRAGSDVLISQTGGLFAGQVPLLGGRRPLEWPRRDAMTYYSTLAGELSHARPKSVSLYTEATLRALRGAGSDDPDDEWWVSTARLHEAVDHFMKEPVFAGAVTGVQVPAVSAMPIFAIHRLDGPPVVPVYVSCEPPDGNGEAEFVCRLGGDEHSRRLPGEIEPPDPAGRWLLELALGTYEFEARLGPDDVRVLSKPIRPIFRTVTLPRTAP